jgi:CAI-1 autoinducer synthase
MTGVQTEQQRQPPSINGPAWFDKMMEEYLVRWRAYEPFPFAQPSDTHNYLSLHQNDYLRLSSHPEVIAAKNSANERSGGGPMASIIYGGDTGEHQQFREALKRCMNVGDIMLTTAGWTANVGLMEAVAAPNSPVYLDYQAHASLWDGAKLAGARIIPVRHNSPEYMERRIQRYGKGVVCIDAYYSTDGSVPDLKRYVEICEAHDCMLVLDEAHSFGMCGRDGGGLAVELGLETRIPIRTVSMSKALGGNGGFIAASEEVVWFLKHRARSVIFSSSPSPAQSAGSYAALQVALREPQRAATCLQMGALLRKYLVERGIDPGLSASQIISLYFDSDPLAAKFYGLMRDKGILVSVFTAPAVPRDTSLARFSIHSDTTPADMQRVADATAECIEKLGVRVTPPYSLLTGAAKP